MPAPTHTPTPWSMRSASGLAGGTLLYVPHVYGQQRIGYAVHEADAAFIVRAVNAHEKLVAALTEMTDEASRVNRAMSDGPVFNPTAIQTARAALAQAGEG